MDSTEAAIDVSYADGTTIEGIQVFDWVCATDNSDTCVTNFKWMNVQTSGLGDSITGILGMCADNDGIEYGIVNQESIADSYIEELYNSGIIDDKVFSFGLRHVDSSDGSFLDIGFYDSDAMEDPSEADLVWIDVVDYGNYNKFWWGNTVTGIRFRASSLAYESSVVNAEEYATGDLYALTDSGSSCLILPSSLYSFVVGRLLGLLTYY